MPLLICPLCGRSVALANFDPRGFDNDIYVKRLKGLGRGQAFEELGRSSALNDSYVISKLKPRLLKLVKLLYSHGLLTSEEIAASVSPLPTAGSGETAALREKVEKQEGILNMYRSKVTEIADDLADA